MYLVDTSAVLAIVLGEPLGEWFAEQCNRARRRGESVAINPIVFAECAGTAPDETTAREALAAHYDFVPLPWAACWPAGRAFVRYRRRGGTRRRMLPDFLVAAHALVERALLVTHNPGDVRAYFPGLRILAPESEHPSAQDGAAV